MTESIWSQDRYLAASRFAAEAHGAQLVPGTQLPYLLHVAQVTMEVIAALRLEAGHNEDLAVQCALLHDVLEDTPISYEQLAAQFGPAVAAGVAALTKANTMPKAAAMADSLARIQAQPQAVWLVKLADRITNLQPPPAHWDAAKIVAYRNEAQTILEALGAASPYLAARLAAKIAAY
ncbi:MAG: HD domain-containing protein [Oscillochloridaceae bacterium umkhey_bin13]